MYNILVSGASGIVGYGILKSLKNCGYNLIGTTIYSVSPADCFSDIVQIVPKATDKDYIPYIIKLIRKYNIHMLIPGIEADMIAWHKHRKELLETGVVLLLNTEELVSLCIDKWEFYKKLKKSNVKCRIGSSLENDFYYFKSPFMLKPRYGYGAKGVVVIKTEEEFQQYKNDIGEKLMMQEYVGTDDEEYTISAFFDYNSNIIASIAMKRKLSKNGYTEIAEVVDVQPFATIVKELSELFLPVGPTNFQFRRYENGWKLLEINPRISSSTSMKTAFGYNESKMAIKYFLEQDKIQPLQLKKGRAIRYIEDYVIYDSDYI